MILEQIRSCDIYRPYIFISYSSQNADLVYRDVLELQKRGYNVWLDNRNLYKTKSTWEEDAIPAVRDHNCSLVLYYVSAWSLLSESCGKELAETCGEKTKALHNKKTVPILVVETEPIDDIIQYEKQVYYKLWNTDAYRRLWENECTLEKIHAKRTELNLILSQIIGDIFKDNNAKVRIKPKDYEGRKIKYYTDLEEQLPKETRNCEEAAEPETDAGIRISESPAVLCEPYSFPSGSPEGMYRQGMNYYLGINDTEENNEKAVEWFGKSAELRHTDAMRMLGICYLYGDGVQQDSGLAAEWLKKAADAGDKTAGELLASLPDAV